MSFQDENRTPLVLCTIVAILCWIPFVLHLSIGLQGVIASIAQFFSGWPFYSGALKKGRATRDTLIAIAITAAYLYGFYLIFSNTSRGIYFETSTFLITFILIGRLLEKQSIHLVEKRLDDLLALQPKYATVKRRDQFVKIPIDELQINDHFIVQPDERIPADGEVVTGRAVIDESMLTGEGLTTEKGVGSPIFAGTVSHHGTMIAKATKLPSETALSSIITMVKQTKQTKTPLQRFTDKIISPATLLILITAFLTFALWFIIGNKPLEGFLNSISVLVVASPSALMLAIPSAIAVASSLAASKGIFIKHAETLETAQKIQRVIVDKENIITESTLCVVKASLSESYYPIVKTICEHSKDPSSQAILAFLREKKIGSIPTMLLFRTSEEHGSSGYFDDRKYILGTVDFLKEQQVPTAKFEEPHRDEIGTLVAFGTGKLGLGYFVLSDQIKPGSKEAVAALKELKIETVLLTSDRRSGAERVAKALNFDFLDAEVLSTDKVRYVEMAKREGKIVAMVGDGVTDAPALAAADIGFATATGTEIVMKAASVGLLHSHLNGVASTIKLSKAFSKKTIQNLTLAIAYNVLVIPLAALGFINPIVASAIMGISSIAIIFSSLNLNKKYQNKC